MFLIMFHAITQTVLELMMLEENAKLQNSLAITGNMLFISSVTSFSHL